MADGKRPLISPDTPPAGPEAYSAGAGNPRRIPKKRHPWLRRLAWAIGVFLLLLAAALAAGWVWLGTNQSLAFALQRTAPYMPAGQQLQSDGVSGSLRRGGHIDYLRWDSPSLTVEARNVDIDWRLVPLLRKQVQLGQLAAGSVVLTPRPQPDELREPLQPLEQISLPVDIDLPFSVAELVWQGAPAQTIRGLSGRYRYEDDAHQLDLTGVELKQGHVSGTVRVGGSAPMALVAELSAQLRAPYLPQENHERRALEVSVSTKVSGQLAGQDARINVIAHLQQVVAASAGDSPNTGAPANTDDNKTPDKQRGKPTALMTPMAPMRADVTASVAPWEVQPLLQAQATLVNVNLAALVAEAPGTNLGGTLVAGPTTEGWKLDADLKNAVPGPINQQLLPISSVTASAHWDGTVWTLPDAAVDTGDGILLLAGSYTPASRVLDASLGLVRLNPAALDTRFAASPLDGTLEAQGTVENLVFDLKFAASGTARANGNRAHPAPLRIDRVAASGRWKDGVLSLPKAEIDALKAQLRASNIRVTTRPNLSIAGNLWASVPGTDLRGDAQLTERTGEGSLSLQVRAAEETLAWMRTLPGLEKTATGLAARGSARLAADWTGGWATLAAVPNAVSEKPRLSQKSTGEPGVRATLEIPRLQLEIPQGDGVGALKTKLEGISLTVIGNAARANMSVRGQVNEGKRSLSLDATLDAAMQQSRKDSSFAVQTQINALSMRLEDGIHKSAWSAKLGDPLAVNLQQGAAGAISVKTSASNLAITAPLPGTVAVQWEPVSFQRTADGAIQVDSQGSFTGIPLAWSDLAAAQGDSPLKKFGLDTNLVFGGQWRVAASDTLSATIRLQRSSGDMRIALDGEAAPTTIKSSGAPGSIQAQPQAQDPSGASTVAAGVREIDLTVTAQGDALRAEFVWDTAQAGVIRAQAATRLSRVDGGWAWPENAPLTGKLRAQLPQVGVWSVLAPPGWRVNGTLDADAALSGTRTDPRWEGTLSADQLAVRSLLDGVDLQDGRLRAKLHGDRVEITEFSLKGGQGNSARIAGFSGNLTPAPSNGGTLEGSGSVQWGGASGTDDQSAAASLQMNFKARAKALQVLGRADRQASLSGTLDASLRNRQFKLRGDLTIDRASIILPEAGAPKLGDDVVVRSAASDKLALEQVQLAAKTAASATRPQPTLPPDVVVKLNLGPDFALKGLGITTRLEGDVTIRGATLAGAPPSVTGEIRTVAGRYRAWGQALDVETGLIRFNGPYANPSLDIFALRPNIEVRAGVQVTGSAQNPRVRLYSEPELPDAEKLSWVVLGRSAAGGGAEAAVLQQAALALLGSKGGGGSGTNVASKLGLDEIGFKGPGAGEDASGAALTFGKRISKDLYVTYERSLSGTLGTLYIFYDLSQRLRLRGQTGAATGLDLIYTVRYE